MKVRPSANFKKKGGQTMDTGEGHFETFATMDELNKLKGVYPKNKGIFTVGEELEIKGSNFRVKEITPFGIRLKLLK